MSPPKQPLRTALIGLSSTAITSWASTAHLPCFQTAGGKTRFQITALLNSSVGAAEKAIKTYQLDSNNVKVKTYGDPKELAEDKDIDFVVCNTRVDKHFETVIDSVQAGKKVYVEWPIASNLSHIHQLVDAAKESGAKVAVGLQGRWAPPVVKLREIVEKGGLGKVLSSEVRAYGGTIDRKVLPMGLKYFTERGMGGNPVTIGFGHVIDFVQSVVGELDPANTHARFQLQRPDVNIKDPESGKIVETVRSDVPDLLSLHGQLQSKHVVPSATLSFLFRRGQPFPSTPSLEWKINFEKGELRLVSPTAIALQAAAYDEPLTIQIHHFDSGIVEDVAWGWSETQIELPIRARGVQSCLYAFSDGVEERAGWVGLEDAAKRAEQIEGWLKASGW